MEYLVIFTLAMGSINTVNIVPVQSCKETAEFTDIEPNKIAFCINQSNINTFKKALGSNKLIREKLPLE